MQRNSMDEPSIVNVVLLGSTGSGKSASGNTIIGVRDAFKEDFSPEAVTRVCQSAQTVVNGQTITVIDTVGLNNTTVNITDAQTQIEEMLTLHSVDVFLLVIKLGEIFRKESWNVVQCIRNNFGAKLSKHTLVLFTHGDQLHEPIEKYLSKCKALRSVADQCSGGFHVFNNKDEDPSQVTELLKKINTLRENNGYRQYTGQDYKETQNDLLVKKCDEAAALRAGAVGVAAALGISFVLGVTAVGAAVGGTIGGAAAVGEALAGETTEAGATVGAAAVTVGKAAIIGAARGVALAAVTAVSAGVFWLYAK